MNFTGRISKAADRLFSRGDKTDVVGELRVAEELTEELKTLTEAFYKSEEKCLNTHHVLDEKKHRKVPANQAAEILKEALRSAPQNADEHGLYRTVTEGVAGAEQLLAKIVLDHEEQIETEVLTPLNKLLKEDFTSVAKQKKALYRAGQDVDAARAKLRNSQSNLGQGNKIEVHKEELEEAESKLEQIRDSYAAELFATLGKERDIARLSCLSLEMKLDFLQKSYKKLNTILPPIRTALHESSCSAVFGVPLHDHLRITKRDIAAPIQICVRRIIETGITEEGIFRMAGSSGKIKRFKGAFDAGLVTNEIFTFGDCSRDYDIHVVSGTLKCYLRELPDPILTHVYHDQWIEAVRKTDHDEKLRSLWQVVNSIPKQNYNNLRYIIKFLSLLSGYSLENKMTPNNIAIVIAPNLIWAQREPEDVDIVAMERNMTLGNDYRTIVEQLIEYCDYFFKGDINFGVVPPKKAEPPSPKPDSNRQMSPAQVKPAASGHRRTASADFNAASGLGGPAPTGPVDCESPKQPHRFRKKPAPQPPQKGALSSSGDDLSQGFPFSDSPEMSRSVSPPPSASDTSSTATPSPAPRLHHTNSIRRPTAEPPKPPSSHSNPPKPPRPSLPSTNPASELKNQPSPIGFEQIHNRNVIESIASSVDDEISQMSGSEPGKGAAPIGFNVGAQNISNVKSKPEDEVTDKVQIRHKDMDNEVFKDREIVPSSFRKSLEGVLKQQPQTLPRHMVRTSSSGEAYEKKDGEKGFQLPAFPVPTLRTTTKDSTNVSDKPEPIPRIDRPAVPEKPSIANRSVVQVEQSKPIIPERPAAITNRASSILKKNEINKLQHEASHDKNPSASDTPPKPILKDAKATVNQQELPKQQDFFCVVDSTDGSVTHLIPLEPEKVEVQPAKPERPLSGRSSDSQKQLENSLGM